MPKSLSEHIRDTLPVIRSQAGKTQEDIARAARLFGLEWDRSAVAAIENDKRDLTNEELLLLPTIISAALARPVTLSDLVPKKEAVGLSPDVTVRAGVLNKMLSGVGAMKADADFTHTGLEVGRQMALARQLRISRQEARNLMNEAAAEPVIQIARKLQRKPVDVVIGARKLWGCSLVEERDRRIAEQSPEPRRLQALRGHITRQLLKELEPNLKKRREP